MTGYSFGLTDHYRSNPPLIALPKNQGPFQTGPMPGQRPSEGICDRGECGKDERGSMPGRSETWIEAGISTGAERLTG